MAFFLNPGNGPGMSAVCPARSVHVDFLEVVLLGAGVYLAIGVVFAPLFAWRGANVIDQAAAGSTWGFRLMILPGAAALWPILLRRWLGAA